MAYFENSAGNIDKSILLITHFIDSLKLLNPKLDHPELATAYSLLGQIYEVRKEFKLATEWFTRAYALSKAPTAKDSLLRSYLNEQDWKSALNVCRKDYTENKLQFGESDEKTLESEKMVKILLGRALDSAMEAKKSLKQI